MEEDHFKDIKKVRNAELHQPENALKDKVGDGGFNKQIVVRAQNSMDDNKADIRPVVTRMIGLLTHVLGEAKAGRLTGNHAIESILPPVMQLEAHGQMFNHPHISKISHIFIDFLETVPEVDDDVLEITNAYIVSANTLMTITNDIAKVSKALCDSLLGACMRYHKRKK